MNAHATGPLPLRDSFIAAIVRARGYRIVTRDTAPFERMGCKVFNPWKPCPHISQAAQIADRAERRSVTGFGVGQAVKPVTDRRSA